MYYPSSTSVGIGIPTWSSAPSIAGAPNDVGATLTPSGSHSQRILCGPSGLGITPGTIPATARILGITVYPRLKQAVSGVASLNIDVVVLDGTNPVGTEQTAIYEGSADFTTLEVSRSTAAWYPALTPAFCEANLRIGIRAHGTNVNVLEADSLGVVILWSWSSANRAGYHRRRRTSRRTR